MSRHRSLSDVLESIGGSGYRTARVLWFIYRHRRAHRRIIGQLNQRHRDHERSADERFRRLQRAALEERGHAHPKHRETQRADR